MKQRVAARLLLASCTLALGLGLGTAIAVVGLLALQHPSLTVRSPGEADGVLDRGGHRLFVSRSDGGGTPPSGSPSDSAPACQVIDLRSGRAAATAAAGRGFAAVRVERGGRHRAACTSAVPVTVRIEHEPEGATAYLSALGRGLLPAVILAVLAALLAARALVTVRRLREADGSPPP